MSLSYQQCQNPISKVNVLSAMSMFYQQRQSVDAGAYQNPEFVCFGTNILDLHVFSQELQTGMVTQELSDFKIAILNNYYTIHYLFHTYLYNEFILLKK